MSCTHSAVNARYMLSYETQRASLLYLSLVVSEINGVDKLIHFRNVFYILPHKCPINVLLRIPTDKPSFMSIALRQRYTGWTSPYISETNSADYLRMSDTCSTSFPTGRPSVCLSRNVSDMCSRPPKKLLGSGFSTPFTFFCMICTINSELKYFPIFTNLSEPRSMSAGFQWTGSTPAAFQEAFRAASS